jgi:hypothetical protein
VTLEWYPANSRLYSRIRTLMRFTEHCPLKRGIYSCTGDLFEILFQESLQYLGEFMAYLDLVHLAVTCKTVPGVIVQVSYNLFCHDIILYHRLYLNILVVQDI